MPELPDDAVTALKEGGSYAIIEAVSGEQITPWTYPDENGEIEFEFSKEVKSYEIALRLEDGTILLGEHTKIEAIEET